MRSHCTIRIRALALCVVLGGWLAVGPFAVAQQYSVGAMRIDHPWARASAPGMVMGAAYMSLTNTGGVRDELIAASSPASASADLHSTIIVDRLIKMRNVQGIVVPPGKVIRLEPVGLHVMLIDLHAPLRIGTTFPLTLQFRRAGRVTVDVVVEQGPGGVEAKPVPHH